jgi:hypothetical protein
MGVGLAVILLLFALVGFGGAGASLAVARSRWIEEADRDLGMWGVAAMLGVFGALCAGVAAGLAGLLAFGLVAVWASYVIMAQRLGIFLIVTGLGGGVEPRAPETRSVI